MTIEIVSYIFVAVFFVFVNIILFLVIKEENKIIKNLTEKLMAKTLAEYNAGVATQLQADIIKQTIKKDVAKKNSEIADPNIVE